MPAELQEGFRLIRQHTTTPIAVGEVFNSHLGLPAAHHRAAHRLHPDAPWCTPAASPTCAASSTWPRCYHVRSGSHGATDLSPVCMAAALHVDISIPNFGLQEYMRHTAETDAVFPHGYRSTTGTCYRSRSPASASTSTRSWPPSTRTARRPCR